VGEGDVCHGLRREEDGGAGMMGKGGGGTDETGGIGQGCKIKGEDGRRWRWGALCSALLGETCLWRGAMVDHNRGGDNGNGEGGGTDEKLADLATVWRKVTREDQDDADKRGGRSPVRRLGNLDRRVTRGQ
jgi:hypothetical protein